MPQGHSVLHTVELENITGHLPRVTRAVSLGKVRDRLGYEPTRIYISFRIF